MDQFLFASWSRQKLATSPLADPAVLLRRLNYTLTGLPPTLAEQAEFLAGAGSDEAWVKTVDRLLASPRYGERWARMWLDLARYADSNGQDENMVMANAWRYRDFVVKAWNEDLPFDRFIKWQLAGDLVPDVSAEQRPDAITATGFLVLGPKQLAEQDKEKMLWDIADEQIDTTGRAFLGMTIGCARCHDHKFDPISQADYYAMAGIFRSTNTMANTDFVSKWNEIELSTPEQKAARAAEEQKLKNLAARQVELEKSADVALRERLAQDAPRYLAAAAAVSAGEQPAPEGLTPEVVSRWKKALREEAAFEPWRALTASPSWRKEWSQSPIFTALQAEAPASLEQARDLFAASLGQLALKPPVLSIVPGKQGGAMSCASNHFLDVPHAPELEPDQFTLETWAKWDKISGEGDARRWIVNKNGDEWTPRHFALGLSGNYPMAYFSPQGGRLKETKVVSQTELTAGEWHHLVTTFDGKDLLLYADGALVGKTTVPKTVPLAKGGGHLRIGGRADGYSHFSEGMVDEVRLYARPLPIEEISRRYREPAFQPVGLVREWTFDPANDEEKRQLALSSLATLTAKLFQLEKPREHWLASEKQGLADLETARKKIESSRTMMPTVLAVSEAKPRNVSVLLRGDHLMPQQPAIPRGGPTHMGLGFEPLTDTASSGRLALAEWIANPRNLLTARVIVNRVWQGHFGQGLVPTPDNFGTTGTAPVMPGLLDWLARDFMEHGWSVKHLQRRILTSRAWRMSCQPQAANQSIDPENRYFWRQSRRRLEAEMIRDSLLFFSDRLDVTGTGPVLDLPNNQYVRDTSKGESSLRRAIYLPVIRDREARDLALFDMANANTSTGRRTSSVVPLQALFFLNSPVMKESAAALAALTLKANAEDSARLTQLWQRLFGRLPTEAEQTRAREYLQGEGGTEPERWSSLCQALLSSNEALYLD